jgi:general secretion pathway protein D
MVSLNVKKKLRGLIIAFATIALTIPCSTYAQQTVPVPPAPPQAAPAVSGAPQPSGSDQGAAPQRTAPTRARPAMTQPPPMPPMPPGMSTSPPVAPAVTPGRPVQGGQAAQQAPAPPQATTPQPPTPRQAARSTIPAANLVQMNFDNIELRDLIRFVANIMGRNFVYDEGTVKGKVTILAPKNLTRDEVFRVFETVINYYGFAVVSTPEALKIVKGIEAKGMAIDTMDTKELDALTPQDKPVTYVARLEYLDSNTMVGALRPMMSKEAYLVSVAATNSLIMIDSASNVQRLKAIIADIDIPVSKQLSSIRVYNVQHTLAADLAKTLQALLVEGKKAQTPKEKIFVTAYPSTNALLISAPAEDLKEIERIVAEIDTLRPQVLVEAAIVEVSSSTGLEFGVEWVGALKTSSSGEGAVGGFQQKGGPLLSIGSAILGTVTDSTSSAADAINAVSTGFNVGFLGPSIRYNGKEYPSVVGFLRALSTKENVNILSTPQILTMNNEEAEVIVGENRPYITTSRVDTAGLPVNSFDYRDVGVKLKVKPSINRDGFVNLNIYQEVTKVTESTVSTGASTSVPAPTTLKRSTKTTVGVRDSQTVVISGLITDDSSGSSTGIPLLSSIPVLGWLFGYRSKTIEKKNLLVFLTPRIIYDTAYLEQISRAKKEEQELLIGKDRKKEKEKER